MTDTVGASNAADQAPTVEDRFAKRARAFAEHPIRVCTGLMRTLAILAGIGAATRLLIVPGPAEAVAAWLAVTALLAIPMYRAVTPRVREKPGPGIVWQIGDPFPAAVPAATMSAVERIMAGTLGRRWRGAWLEIAPCTDPVRHGMCRRASATPGGEGMVRVVVGEHVAGDPWVTAFTVAHEIRHPTGPTYHISMLTTSARLAGWLAAGWAVPWPWLLVAVAAIQALYAAACWAVESGCDIGAVRAEGHIAARASFDYYRHARIGEPVAWKRYVTWLLFKLSVPTAHPPLGLRAAITRLVPAER